MKIPNNPISGRSIKEDFRALLAFARASRIVGISGGKLRTTPNGTTIEIPTSSTRGVTRHPFELEPFDDDGTLKLRVHYGQAQVAVPMTDSAGNVVMSLKPASLDINGGNLVGDPAGLFPGAGEVALTNNDDTGVWLKISTSVDPSTTYAPPAGSEVVTMTAFQFGGGSVVGEVMVSTSFPEPTDAAAITASATGYAFFYIGKLKVDADSKVEVEQHLRSDIQLPGSFFAYDLISGDASNEIVKGSDNGLFYEQP